MIDDPNIEYEPNQEFDENGEPIFYIEKDYTADEFTSYNFNEEPPAFPDSYYESVWDTGTGVSALTDGETTGEELTDRIELEDELKDSVDSQQENTINQTQESYNNAVDTIINVLTAVLDKGEITAEDNATILQAQSTIVETEEQIKQVCNDNKNINITTQLENIKENMVSATVDDILNILTVNGTKPWLYKDDNNNVLVDAQSIPELTVLVNKLNLIATDGEDESQLQLTPEFIKLMSDVIILDAKKIELNGSININNGLFKVSTSGRTQIGGMTGHIIDDYERAQLEINTMGTLYSVSKTVEDYYAKLSEGYLQFVNGNQVCRITAAGPDTTSDIRLKDNINKIQSDFAIKFINAQNPVSYIFKNEKNAQIQYGLIAQELESSIQGMGLESTSLGILHTPKNSNEYYGIQYTNFIPLLISYCQSLYQDLSTCKEEIKTLKNQLKICEV